MLDSLNFWLTLIVSSIALVLYIVAFERKYHLLGRTARWVKAQTVGRLRARTETLHNEIKRLKQVVKSLSEQQVDQFEYVRRQMDGVADALIKRFDQIDKIDARVIALTIQVQKQEEETNQKQADATSILYDKLFRQLIVAMRKELEERKELEAPLTREELQEVKRRWDIGREQTQG